MKTICTHYFLTEVTGGYLLKPGFWVTERKCLGCGWEWNSLEEWIPMTTTLTPKLAYYKIKLKLRSWRWGRLTKLNWVKCLVYWWLAKRKWGSRYIITLERTSWDAQFTVNEKWRSRGIELNRKHNKIWLSLEAMVSGYEWHCGRRKTGEKIY